jgi:hypothetical protein
MLAPGGRPEHPFLRTIHDALAEDAQSQMTIALKVALALEHPMRTTTSPPGSASPRRRARRRQACGAPAGDRAERRGRVNALWGARPGARRSERVRFAGKRPSSRSVFYTEFDGRRSKRMIIKVIGE